VPDFKGKLLRATVAQSGDFGPRRFIDKLAGRWWRWALQSMQQTRSPISANCAKDEALALDFACPEGRIAPMGLSLRADESQPQMEIFA